MTPWIELRSHRAWLRSEYWRLLGFGLRVGLPEGGAGYLDDRGVVDPARGVQTYVSARMAHVYYLGALSGIPGCLPVADAALAGLTGRLADDEAGGWYRGLTPTGVPDLDAGKSCYDHAFVLLAASTAVAAGRPSGTALLERASDVFLKHFWDDDEGLVVDSWDRDFTKLDDYRGLNATMHSLEAMLSVASVLGGVDGQAWLDRASRTAKFVSELVDDHDGRIPEHFAPGWTPLLDLNRDRPDDQFKPYGATPGHALEWSRLLLHTEAALGGDDELLAAAMRLFDRAVTDGWDADGAPGFVYTTDWDGTPIVRARMHWVLAEAINAAAVLYRRTGEPAYAEWYAAWWDYASQYLIDPVGGSWWHELDPSNRPTATVWPGKPDLYHAVQATLVPALPLWPMVAAALRDL